LVTNFEVLLKDWAILLPPTSTPLSNIEFARRLPSGNTEKLKHSVRSFFLLRNLYFVLNNEEETQLPLTKQEHLVKENDALDLNSSDLIACTVSLNDKKDRRFLVIDPIQFILVEPEVRRIGWGIVKFSDLIQDVEVTQEPNKQYALSIRIQKATAVNDNGKPQVILDSLLVFDDYIRCTYARKHLVKGREKSRKVKLEKIAQLLELTKPKNKITNKLKDSASCDTLPFTNHNGNSLFILKLIYNFN
jgi:protein CLEC16A